MKRYYVHTSVLDAHGEQVWLVEAESPEAAVEAVKRGEGEIASEEIEVTHVSEPHHVEEVVDGDETATEKGGR